MAKSKSVSSKTHTKQQLDDYANQHNRRCEILSVNSDLL